MSIIVEGGRRRVSVSVDLPGTVEEVWEAVASAPGITAWSLPTELELGFDDAPTRLITHLGATRTTSADVKEWEPPRRFLTVTEDLAPGCPCMITEWTVQPQALLGCQVTVSHLLETSLPDWDDLLLQAEEGWHSFFRVLEVYLAHFPGKKGCGFAVVAYTSVSPARIWETLAEPLGLVGPDRGERFRSEADAPLLAGIVESRPTASHFEALLRLSDPAHGIAQLRAVPKPSGTQMLARFYLYGEQAPPVASREEPRWQAWLSELLAGTPR